MQGATIDHYIYFEDKLNNHVYAQIQTIDYYRFYNNNIPSVIP